jgi:hypothetical protein
VLVAPARRRRFLQASLNSNRRRDAGATYSVGGRDFSPDDRFA